MQKTTRTSGDYTLDMSLHHDTIVVTVDDYGWSSTGPKSKTQYAKLETEPLHFFVKDNQLFVVCSDEVVILTKNTVFDVGTVNHYKITMVINHQPQLRACHVVSRQWYVCDITDTAV